MLLLFYLHTYHIFGFWFFLVVIGMFAPEQTKHYTNKYKQDGQAEDNQGYNPQHAVSVKYIKRGILMRKDNEKTR